MDYVIDFFLHPKLNERDRIIYIFRYGLGLPVTRIASLYSLSRPSIYNSLYKTKHILIETDYHDELISALQQICIRDFLVSGYLEDKE